MSRAVPSSSFRPSDVMRVNKVRKGQVGSKLVAVVEIDRPEDDTFSTRVYYREIKEVLGDRPFLANSLALPAKFSSKILHSIEGVWEGELLPGSRGRVVLYNNRRCETPTEGEGQMPTARKTAPAKGGRKPAAATTKATERAERASEAQMDKQAAQVVKMRDNQGKSWGDIEAATGIASSRLRALYNRGGGTPNATKSTGAKPAAAKAKPAARGRAAAKKTTGRGKRNPS